MIRTIAVLSDIHGVLPALDAVLEEPEVIAADRIVVTGDMAAGPQPAAVLDRLLALGERVVWVRGNADRELADLALGRNVIAADEIPEWAATQLSLAHISLLDALPHPIKFEIEGFADVLFCHGSPRDENEIMLVDTGIERWAEVLAEVPSSVTTIVCGHTHMPFMRLAHGRLIVNAGSVGMPYGRPGAHWALLRDGAVHMYRSLFMTDAAIASIAQESNYPRILEWIENYALHTPGDAEALMVFGPRAGHER